MKKLLAARMSIDPRPSLRKLACALAVATTVGCGSEPQESTNDDITIGLLLPFTGSDSATASNFERAALFARDQVNAAGGIKGRKLSIVAADTHSDVGRAKESANGLIDDGALVIIGPENAEIAAAIRPMLDSRDVVFLSPLVGAADDKAVDCTTPWFRIAPSASVLGEALAKQAISDGARRAGTLHSDAAYDVALRTAFSNRFRALKGDVVFEQTLQRDAQSYAKTLEGALQAGVETILLAASPRLGALAVNELGALTAQPPRWLLSPLLKTDLLLQNVAPEVLENSNGVAPKIYEKSTKFPTAFAERWQGDEPLEGAFFYYDAAALTAFALEKTELVDGHFVAADLRRSVFAVSGLPGEPGHWDEMEQSLARLRQHDFIYYAGLTGPMLLNPCGDRKVGAYSRWEVHGGAIVEVAQ